MLYMTYAFVYVMCVWNDFSDRSERPQTGDNGRCESIAQVAIDLLRDRQHQNNDQPSNNHYATENEETVVQII